MEFSAVDKPPADPNAFINFPDGTKLYVPKGAQKSGVAFVRASCDSV
jgi:hypothetical protein